MKIKKYKCLCCGYYTLDGEQYDICPVCYRENGWINTPDGTNKGLTLAEMRDNYKKFKACNRKFVHYVRPPFKHEISDTDSEYIFSEIDYPDYKQIAEMLNKVISGELTKRQVSLWADAFLDLSCDLDNIDGYYEINQDIKAVLDEVLDLIVESDEETNEYNDVKDILKRLSEENILKGCE